MKHSMIYRTSREALRAKLRSIFDRRPTLSFKNLQFKELCIRAGFLLGTSILCLNINSLYLSASTRASLLVGTSTELTQNDYTETVLTRSVIEATSAWVDTSAEELSEVRALWDEQRTEHLMNDAPQDSIAFCETFYTAEDFEALSLPTVSVTSGTALRMTPSDSATAITTVSSSTKATLLFEYAGWCYVELSATYRGYVPADTVDLSSLSEEALTELNLVNKCRYGIAVTDSALTLYAKPNASSSTVGEASTGTVLEVVGYTEDGWYQVNTSDGTAYVSADDATVDWYLAAEVDDEGYIRTVHEEIKAKEAEEAARKAAEEAARKAAANKTTVSFDSVSGSSLADFARTLLGIPYVYGGSSLSGFDCSGLVYYVYSHFGLSIPRGAASQFSRCRTISKSELQPGDLVFFSYSGSLDHVGIYIGNGQFIHSPRSGDVVKINSLSDSWYASTYYASGTFLH